MLDAGKPRDRIILAALKRAETQAWRDLSLSDIAAEAQMPLAALRREFGSKAEILSAFTRAVDDAVLAQVSPSAADVPRDRLFDVILTRFEIMQPYKAALRSIHDDLRLKPGLALAQLKPVMKSQYWMMQAAGINAEGGRGLLRIKGMTSIYSSIFSIWLDDSDPGMARTMAALDRKLRRGENTARRVESLCDGIENFIRTMRGTRHSGDRNPPPGEAGPAEPPPAPPTPPTGPSPSPAQF